MNQLRVNKDIVWKPDFISHRFYAKSSSKKKRQRQRRISEGTRLEEGEQEKQTEQDDEDDKEVKEE